MRTFRLGSDIWTVAYVDPWSDVLIDRTGRRTIAVTDPNTRGVYLSDDIRTKPYGFRRRVVIHELAHCAMVSFGLLPDIHRMVSPEYQVEAEEWICNFIADYGLQIYDAASDI